MLSYRHYFSNYMLVEMKGYGMLAVGQKRQIKVHFNV